MSNSASKTNLVDLSQLISTAEAAKLLGIHPNTIRAHIAAGHLTGYQVGRLIKINSQELQAFVKMIDNRS